MNTCARGCCPSPREHYKSLSFFGTGEGTVHDRERTWAKDMDAYRRLRKNGVQPPKIDGSAQLEASASTKEEIEYASARI